MARIDLRDNEFMERFVGQDHINSNDNQFWYQFLTCSFNFMRVQDPRVVDKTLDPYLVRLALNNSESKNIGSLARVFLDRVSRVKTTSTSTNPYYLFQSFNALYLLRSICKSYIETSSEEQLIKALRAKVDEELKPIKVTPPPLPPIQSQAQQQLPLPPLPEPQPEQGANGVKEVDNNETNNNQQENMPVPEKKVEITSGSTILEQFISALISIIVDIPITDSTYQLQVESINALLVLLSVQMYSANSTNQSAIYKCLMHKKCSIHALVLTKTLLNNFVNQNPVPHEAGSIIIGLASGLWKVLTLGYGGQEDDEVESMPLLAKQSLSLLNILTNHYNSEKNPYREAIVSCQDTQYNLTDPKIAFDNAENDALATATTSKSVMMSNSIKIDFHKLFETICKHLHNDQVALLLYLLLHSNKIFRPYILTTASSELDRLLLPLLKILYSSIEKGSHHVYMVLILFVMLSEENSFNQAIHKITIRGGIPWYKDRLLNDISLGSLTVLIIVRSFQYNTFRIRDKFLHSNLYATFANLSSHFHELHPYVCQRMVDLLERLTKRYLVATKPAHDKTIEVLNSNNPLAKALATDTNKQFIQDASSIELDHINISIDDNKQDINLIEEVIKMVLEVINNSLATQLRGNPDLIYTLLYKRSVFSSLLSSHQSFYNLVINIERILTFFYNKVEKKAEALDRSLSVDEIKDLIKESSKDWNFDSGRDPNARLLFRYVEDEQPEEFFIPYIWTRIYYSSGIAWNSKRIVLFHPDDL